jgi:hypothetical protein
MSQNATRNQNKSRLSPVQVKVLGKLLQGATISAAAKDVGISRETVHRWMRRDWNFIASLNQRKRNLLEALDIRLLKIANLASRKIEDSFLPGNFTSKDFAMDLLKNMGLLNGKPPVIGADDPEALRKETEIKELEMIVLRQDLRAKVQPRKKIRLICRNNMRSIPHQGATEEQNAGSLEEKETEGA